MASTTPDRFTTPDHLVYVVPDLDAAVAGFEQRTGVRPLAGGPHPGRGTRMALVALGERTYLELIGPDPAQPAPQRPRSFGMDGRAAPALVTWAVGARAEGADELEARLAAARDAGYDPGDLADWSRDRPDGVHLAWRMTMLRDPLPADGLVPFLIDWGGSPHPAAAAPGGCRLVDLRGEHPQPAPVQATLRALGVDLSVRPAETPALIATLETPSGPLELR